VIVGAIQGGGGGGGGAATVMLAEAAAPLPPSTEVTTLVLLSFVPAVMPVTFTLKVHEESAASVAPVKLMLPDPAVAAIVPPPQLPMSPLGVETTRPPGSASVTPTPVNVVDPLKLAMVKLSEVDPFSGMLAAPKDLEIVGGDACAHAPPEIKQRDASMQPRRMRQGFMNGFSQPLVRRSLGSRCIVRQR
jgi:hypothetical protein